MAEPKITVIVPTRERCDVLEKCLRTLTKQDYGNLEILVSDNFSSDDTTEVVRAANDRRIRYVNTGQRVSMSHNWEFALSNVTDGWVTFIGDDDGLPARAIETVADIIANTDVMAIRSRFATYEWPEICGQDHGYLIVPRSTGLEIRTSATWLARVMRGHAKYTELPVLYNGGYADMAVLSRIKQVMGCYFHSANPDVYSGVAIGRMVDRYAYTHVPLAISGSSRHSTGTSFYSKSKQRNLSPSRNFSMEGNIPFHPDLPLRPDGSYPLSLHALVYEAYLQSSAIQPDERAEDPVRQLEIIMATSGKHRASVFNWARRFASLHGLDYAAARRGAFLRMLSLVPTAAFRKLVNAIDTDCAGSSSLPIRDVHEASIAMTSIRGTSPFLGTLRAEFNRRIPRL